MDAHALPVIGHRIAGKIDTAAGRRSEVFDPAAGVAIASVALADRAVVDHAVAAAVAALPAWSDTAPPRRARVLFKFKELLESNFDALALSITREHGKTLS